MHVSMCVQVHVHVMFQNQLWKPKVKVKMGQQLLCYCHACAISEVYKETYFLSLKADISENKAFDKSMGGMWPTENYHK